MNYNFKGVFSNSRVLGKTEFRRMMSFIHAYNNIKESGVTSEGAILRQLIARGFNDASAINQIIKRIAGGSVPSVEQENEFMGEYFNYTQELRREAEQNLEDLEKHYNDNKVFEVNGRTYSASELKEVGPQAAKKARRSKLARVGLVVAGALGLGFLAPAVLTGLFTGIMATSTLSLISGVAGIAGLGFGGFLGKKLYDMGGRKERLQNNVALANLYNDSKDLIREQELAIENARSRVYSLEDTFGVQRDAYGNEVGNAYNDIYNDFTREGVDPREVPDRRRTPTRPEPERRTPGRGMTFEEIDEFVRTAYEPEEEPEQEDNNRKPKLDPSFGKNMTREDIDQMIEDVFGKQEPKQEDEDNSKPKLDPSFGKNMTHEDIDQMIEDVFGKQEIKQENEDNTESEDSILEDWVKEEAKEYAKYLESKRYSGIVPQESISDFKEYIERNLKTVLDDNTSEGERLDAFMGLKNTYIDAKHKINMQELAPVLVQFNEYKKADAEFEDRDFDLLISRIGQIKKAYEGTKSDSIEDLDKKIENMNFEENLVDIARTYAYVRDNQTKLNNGSKFDLTTADKEKYAKWSDEHQKFMHIVIENACDERETLSELEDITKNDKHEYISYIACNRDAKEINSLLARKAILEVQEEISEPEIASAEAQPDAINEVDENVNSYNPISVADEIMRREAIDRRNKAELAKLAEEQKIAKELAEQEAERINKENAEKEAKEAERLAAEKAEEERKARRRANIERAKALFEASPTQEELDELKEESNSNLPPQMRDVFNIIESQKAENVAPSTTKPKKSRMVTSVYREEKLKELQDAVKNNQQFANAGGRYLISIVSKDALEFMKNAQTTEELEDRCDKAKKFVDVIVNKYRLYTDVDIINKKNKNKVRCLREINPEDEKKYGVTKGEKCNTTVVKGFSSAEAQAHYDAVLDSYMSDFEKSCKGAKDLTDETSAQLNKQIKKHISQYKKQIQEAISNGEHPLTAIDKVMIKAYNGLSAYVSENMYKLDSVEEQEM